jgi:CHAT domain-containing protein
MRHFAHDTMLAGHTAMLAGYYAFGGRIQESEETIARAHELLDEARDRPDWPANGARATFQVISARAVLAAQTGRFVAAERRFRSALRVADGLEPESFGYTGVRVRMRMSLAEVLTKQNRFAEAELVLRHALKDALLKFGTKKSEVPGLPLLGLVGTRMDQGRFAEAERLARIAIALLDGIGYSPKARLFLWLRVKLASVLVFQGKRDEALALFREVEEDFPSRGSLKARFFWWNTERALAQLNAGRIQDANEHSYFSMDVRRRYLGALHYDTAEARAVRAMVNVARGAHAEALALFRLAEPILASPSNLPDGNASPGAPRAVRLARIFESYISFLIGLRGTKLATEEGIDVVAETFRVAQLAGSRSVQAALTSSLARAITGDPDTADLLRREQDAGNQWNALSRLLRRAIRRSKGDPEARDVVSLKARMDRIGEARTVLTDEIRRRHPDYFQFRDPEPVSVLDVRASLRPGESLLATFVTEDRTLVWAIPKSGQVQFHVSNLGRSEITRIVDRLRGALDPEIATVGEVPDFDVASSHRLYAELLAPVKAAWRNSETLFVVAHDPLDRLPFSVLAMGLGSQSADDSGVLFSRYRSVPWLARELAVATLPSASSLVALRRTPRSSRPRRGFVGFGDPQFNPTRTASLAPIRIRAFAGLPLRRRAGPRFASASRAKLSQLPRLPDTADEVIAIARALKADPARDLFIGPAATEARVKSMKLSDYRIIAFATHGLAAGDLVGLGEPALALTAPRVSGGNDDGLLTMGEIMRLRLDADWVVLSACNTASGRTGGAEAVSGLGRAFFFAGTRTLLVSNWRVESASAKTLATDLFARYASDPKLGKAEALRRAMIGLMDGPGVTNPAGRTMFSYAHPIFWAPFSVVGDGGVER